MTAHPDKGGSEAKMAAVNEAYEVLSNPGKSSIVHFPLAHSRTHSTPPPLPFQISNAALTPGKTRMILWLELEVAAADSQAVIRLHNSSSRALVGRVDSNSIIAMDIRCGGWWGSGMIVSYSWTMT